jgi:hypothetical protein
METNMMTESQREAAKQVRLALAEKARELILRGALERIVGQDVLKDVDLWTRKQNPSDLDRIDAVRRLIDLGLKTRQVG